MELDPFLALEHVPITPPSQPPPQPPLTSQSAHPSSSSSQQDAPFEEYNETPTNAPNPPAMSRGMSRDLSADPLASLLDEPTTSNTTSKSIASNTATAENTTSNASTATTSDEINEELATILQSNPALQPAITSLQSHIRKIYTEQASLRQQVAKQSITANKPSSSTAPSTSASNTGDLEDLHAELTTLKEKNSKLKSLLGRSAKAQRDAKNELEHYKKLYEEVLVEKERLEERVEVLANRPTHMDLLADFESNFDRALLSLGTGNNQEAQTGGEDPSSGDALDDHHAGIASSGGLGHGNSAYQNNQNNHNCHSYSSLQPPRDHRDSLLLTELNEAKSRITHLESLHSSLLARHTNLERTHTTLLSEHAQSKTSYQNTLTNLQLELRMSKMETDHAMRDVKEREASLREMQLEINLVTQSLAEANQRAKEGMEIANSAKIDKEYVDGLEAKVVALQEWALASAESKRVTGERARGLEGRVKELEGELMGVRGELELLRLNSARGLSEDELSGVEESSGDNVSEVYAMSSTEAGSLSRKLSTSSIPSQPTSLQQLQTKEGERKLYTKSSSLVVGAGMIGHHILKLEDFTENGKVDIEPYETLVLRWKFDLTPADLDIYFSVLKGVCEEKRRMRGADACFRNRHVQGGGGGDVTGAFAVQNACTLVWSNEMSWVRPRTIKWTVDVVAIEWSD